jgi:4'-phosphopantetheinyl transferase
MNSDEIHWRPANPGEMIYSNEVHVWREFLDLSTLQNKRLLGILSSDELVRAGRLRYERDQKRFIAARGILRIILGRYLGENPQKIHFEYTSNGKPVLANNPGNDTLCFNLSHSDALALYAVTRGRNIGIDIERVRDDVAVEEIAQEFFSQDEISSLERIHKKKRNEVFFRYWTRKEALLKAMGEGISFPMEHFDVSSISGRDLSPIIFSGDKRESPRWYVQDLFPGRGFAAAIAGERGDWDLSFLYQSV